MRKGGNSLCGLSFLIWRKNRHFLLLLHVLYYYTYTTRCTQILDGTCSYPQSKSIYWLWNFAGGKDSAQPYPMIQHRDIRAYRLFLLRALYLADMVKILKPVIYYSCGSSRLKWREGGMWKRRQHDRQKKGGPIVLTGVSSQLQMCSSSRSSRNSIWSNGELPVLLIRVLDIVEEASRNSLYPDTLCFSQLYRFDC